MIFQGLDSRVALYQILTFVRVLIDSISGSRFSLTVAAVATLMYTLMCMRFNFLSETYILLETQH